MSNDLSVKNRLIFLRGGFAGYLLAKRGEKIWNKILDWADKKTDSNSKDSLFSSNFSSKSESKSIQRQLIDFLKGNPFGWKPSLICW